MKVLVIGAGIGGLALARALLADDHDVTVFERAPALRVSGAALTLWSNGTGVLADLGVSLAGVGAPIDLLEQRGWDGRVLMRIDVSRAADAYGLPHIALPRRRLIERLADELPTGTVLFDKACVRVAQHADGVRVDFADGTTATGDLLVGADGHRSVVRDHLWGADPTRPSGWVTWQGLSRVDIDVASSRRGLMIVGPEGMCGLMPAGEGLLQWWFDVRRRPDAAPVTDPLAALRDTFAHWASPVPDTLAAVAEGEVEFFAHYRHKVPRTWGRGRATVLGDAAHTMPPTMAQGANQALDDAWVLARALRRTADRDPALAIPRALAEYERSRSPRAALTARRAGPETTNKYLPTLFRLMPDPLISRYYTRWLRQVSAYLSDRPTPPRSRPTRTPAPAPAPGGTNA
ncbi:FAD-dependent oxidoreductase [Embleya scabrispora]|uniref:FAD-dependent oxidoreductase n=1 Tax=Embleya scabrispora TaxID=159449 RepID=UPI00037B5232|nr:NAD(P)/FAD-dependent oxidoreductase [Embleya scabrispora]MYS86009.1 NAD(P)-binding protein [Streptomyces sp. SID5474]